MAHEKHKTASKTCEICTAKQMQTHTESSQVKKLTSALPLTPTHRPLPLLWRQEREPAILLHKGVQRDSPRGHLWRALSRLCGRRANVRAGHVRLPSHEGQPGVGTHTSTPPAARALQALPGSAADWRTQGKGRLTQQQDELWMITFATALTSNGSSYE